MNLCVFITNHVFQTILLGHFNLCRFKENLRAGFVIWERQLICNKCPAKLSKHLRWILFLGQSTFKISPCQCISERPLLNLQPYWTRICQYFINYMTKNSIYTLHIFAGYTRYLLYVLLYTLAYITMMFIVCILT